MGRGSLRRLLPSDLASFYTRSKMLVGVRIPRIAVVSSGLGEENAVSGGVEGTGAVES